MNKDQEFNHVVRAIPNTEENRDKIKQLNKMAKESKSIHRFKIKYRGPFPVSMKPDSKGWYAGGGCRKEDARYFSVYLETTKSHQERVMEHQHYVREREIEETRETEGTRLDMEIEMQEKYDKLLDKYLALKLDQMLKGYMGKLEELQVALDDNESKIEIIKSLMTIGNEMHWDRGDLDEFVDLEAKWDDALNEQMEITKKIEIDTEIERINKGE